jgi:putative flippase GtrA
MPNLLQQFLRREAHPIVQFIKYGLAGGLATVVDLSVTYFLALKIIPALTSNDVAVRLLHLEIIPVEEAVRARNYVFCRAIAFMFSNLTAYVANVLWVFKPGKHSRAKEITLFYLVSAVSFGVGVGLGWALVKYFSFTTTNALLVNAVASVMINYVCRKFIIFKG